MVGARWTQLKIQEGRWTDEELEELQAELMRRHRLDPSYKQCADAIGSLQMDLTDELQRRDK